MFGLNQLALGLIIIGVLSATNLFTAYEWQHTAKALSAETAAHKSDVTNFKAAQKVADDNAKALEAKIIKEAKADAEQADKSYTTLLTQYRASLVRYRAEADARGAQASGDSTRPAPKGSDGPSTNPQLPQSVTISGNDADICAINTARLVAIHDWALSLPKGSP